MTTKKKPETKVDELKKVLKKQKGGHVAGKPLEKLTSQLKTAEEEAKAHYDKLLRAMAELDNVKKRSQRETQEMAKYANEGLLTDLLPVLDDIDRVVQHLPEGASEKLVNFASGIELVLKQFLNVLSKYGLHGVEADGKKFDPELHEAVAHIPNEKVKEDHVIEVHRKGYLLKDRLLRPSMVTVSKGKE